MPNPTELDLVTMQEELTQQLLDLATVQSPQPSIELMDSLRACLDLDHEARDIVTSLTEQYGAALAEAHRLQAGIEDILQRRAADETVDVVLWLNVLLGNVPNPDTQPAPDAGTPPA